MAPQTPSREPSQFVAGDTITWTRDVPDYPSGDGWQLHYMLVGPGTLTAQPVVQVVNGGYTVTLAASATANATAGSYRLIGYVDGVNSERHTVFDGYVEILPNVVTSSFAGLQTHAETMLAAIESALEGRSTADIEQYTIDGTAITKIPFGELMRYRGIYEGMVWRERNPGKAVPKIAIRFGSETGPTNAAERLGWPGISQ